METMLASLIVDQQEMVKHFDGCLDHHSGRQERHQAELESVKIQGGKHSHNQEEIITECELLKAQILSMEGQLCRCGRESLRWKGKGCQGHSSLDAPSELNPPQRIPSLFWTPLVPQAEG